MLEGTQLGLNMLRPMIKARTGVQTWGRPPWNSYYVKVNTEEKTWGGYGLGHQDKLRVYTRAGVPQMKEHTKDTTYRIKVCGLGGKRIPLRTC